MKRSVQLRASGTAHPRHHLHRHAAVRALPGVRPPTWQRRAVHGSVLALLVTGVAWLAVHYLLGGDMPHPAEAWTLRLHGIVAYVSLLVFGSMSAVHILVAWRLKRHRVSGSVLVGGVLLLAATALALYYGSEAAHGAVSLVHWIAGLVLLPLLWTHILIARRARAR